MDAKAREEARKREVEYARGVLWYDATRLAESSSLIDKKDMAMILRQIAAEIGPPTYENTISGKLFYPKEY